MTQPREESSKTSVTQAFDVNPDLDSLRVLHPVHWMHLKLLVAIGVLALVYLFFGRIPVTVEGNAMFMTPGTVVPFQASASGQILRWKVKVGDTVSKGQLIAELGQPLIEKQLEQAQEQLQDLKTRNETLRAQSDAYVELEKEAIERKKEMLSDRIETLTGQIKTSGEALKKVHRRKKLYLAQRRADLQKMRELNRDRQTEMADKLAVAEKLKKKGLRSEDQVLRTKRQQMAQNERSSSSELELVQSSLDGARAAERMLQAENRISEQEQQIADLQHQMQDLLSREAQLGEESETAFFAREMEASEVKRNIARFVQQLRQEREVRANHGGRILELTRGEGEIVGKGTTLGSIDTRTKTSTLAAIAYFKLTDGKKIQPGMTIRLVPAIVEEARYGGILAIVRSVSQYPVTAEGVAHEIGNIEAARLLTKNGHQMEVYAELLLDDTFSGYAWERFGGPEMKVTAGTIASAKVNTKEPRAIAFVIPILKDL